MERDSWVVRAVAEGILIDEGLVDVICLCCGDLSFKKAYVFSCEYRLNGFLTLRLDSFAEFRKYKMIMKYIKYISL